MHFTEEAAVPNETVGKTKNSRKMGEGEQRIRSPVTTRKGTLGAGTMRQHSLVTRTIKLFVAEADYQSESFKEGQKGDSEADSS